MPGRRAPGGRPGPLAYLTAAAAVYLLATGKAEASIGGEDPIIALIRTLGEEGTPVPSPLRELIESDEELRRRVEEAARSGDLNAAQRAASERALEILAENMDQFTDDEIRALLTASEGMAHDAPELAPTLDQLRAAARQRGIPVAGEGAGGPGGGAAGGPGGPAAGARPGGGPRLEGPAAGTEPGGGITPEAEGPAGAGEGLGGADAGVPGEGGQAAEGTGAAGAGPEAGGPEGAAGISEEQLRALEQVPQNTRTLWARLTGEGPGAAVDDEVVREYLRIFGEGLTEEELRRLTEELVRVEDETAEEILQRLERRLQQIRAGEEAAAREAGDAERGREEGEPISPEERWSLWHRMWLATKDRTDWPGAGEMVIRPAGGRFPPTGDPGTGTLLVHFDDGALCGAGVSYRVAGRDTGRVRLVVSNLTDLVCMTPTEGACPLDSPTRPEPMPPQPYSCRAGPPARIPAPGWWRTVGVEGGTEE